MIYATQDAAFARADRLRRDTGIWPGVVTCAGGYRLTFDPQETP